MYQPWLAHYFPGLTLEQLQLGYWSLSTMVAMSDFAKSTGGEG
jgi:hypothetical protein